MESYIPNTIRPDDRGFTCSLLPLSLSYCKSLNDVAESWPEGIHNLIGRYRFCDKDVTSEVNDWFRLGLRERHRSVFAIFAL